MAGQRTAVFGVFSAGSQADKAVSRLTSAGFSNSDISLLESTIDSLLAGLEIPQHYEGYAKEGSLLLLVHCFDDLEIDRANTILEQNGAERIFSTGEIPITTWCQEAVTFSGRLGKNYPHCRSRGKIRARQTFVFMH